MLAVVFALIAALGFGISDFYGGLATRKIGTVAATLTSYSSGVVLIGLGMLLIPSAWSLDTVWFGSIAGVTVALGFLAFYAAIAIGPVAVLAPLIAVLYAAIPVIWAVGRGEHLSPLAWVGIVTGILAVFALSVPAKGGAENDEERAIEEAQGRKIGPSPLALVLGVLAALGMGAASVALDYAPKDAGIAPAFVESVVAVVVVAIVFVFVRRPSKTEVNYRAVGVAALSGLLLAVGNAGFVLALQNGSLALVGVLVSLYPLATILLARFVIKEHLSKVQWFGVGLAVLAAVLLGIG